MLTALHVPAPSCGISNGREDGNESERGKHSGDGGTGQHQEEDAGGTPFESRTEPGDASCTEHASGKRQDHEGLTESFECPPPQLPRIPIDQQGPEDGARLRKAEEFPGEMV